jgi:hypothetical protein
MDINSIATTTRIQLENLFDYAYPEFTDMVQLRLDQIQEWLTKYSKKDHGVIRMFEIHGIKIIKK